MTIHRSRLRFRGTNMLGPSFWKGYFGVYDVLNLLPTYRELLSNAVHALDPKQGQLILDAGSGSGNLAQLIQQRGARVIGLDYCKQALTHHRSKDGDCSLVLSDLTRLLPFKDNTFDGIASNNTLYALNAGGRAHAAKELCRVLKPGGRIVLSNPKVGGKPILIYRAGLASKASTHGVLATLSTAARATIPTIKMFYYNRKLAKAADYQYFHFDEQKALLENAGFQSVSDTRLVYASQALMNTAYK